MRYTAREIARDYAVVIDTRTELVVAATMGRDALLIAQGVATTRNEEEGVDAATLIPLR
jgi:hypothetical protein